VQDGRKVVAASHDLDVLGLKISVGVGECKVNLDALKAASVGIGDTPALLSELQTAPRELALAAGTIGAHATELVLDARNGRVGELKADRAAILRDTAVLAGVSREVRAAIDGIHSLDTAGAETNPQAQARLEALSRGVGTLSVTLSRLNSARAQIVQSIR
jgi:hypothetical protein